MAAPTAGRSAVSDLRWTVAGAILPAVLMGVLNILLARALPIAEFGEWVFFTQIAGYTVMTLLGVTTFTLSYHIPRGDFDGLQLLKVTAQASLAIGVAGGLLALALSPIALDAPSFGGVALGALLSLTTSFQYWAFCTLDAVLRFADRARYSLINAALSLALVVALLAGEALTTGAALASRSVAVLVAGFLAWRLGRSLIAGLGPGPGSTAAIWREILDAWPSTAGTAIGVVTLALVLTAIGAFGGQASVGAAGVGMLLTQPISLLSLGLTTTLLPHGANQEADHSSLWRVGVAVSGMALVYTIGVSLSGRWLMALITGEEPSRTTLDIALLLLWGSWLKQVTGLDVVMLRARNRLFSGLVLALMGAIPIVPLFVLLTPSVEDAAMRVAAAWAVSQALALVTSWFVHRWAPR